MSPLSPAVTSSNHTGDEALTIQWLARRLYINLPVAKERLRARRAIIPNSPFDFSRRWRGTVVLRRVRAGALQFPSVGSVRKPRHLNTKEVRDGFRPPLPRYSRSSACCIRDAKVHIGPCMPMSSQAAEVTFHMQTHRGRRQNHRRVGTSSQLSPQIVDF